MNKFKFYEDNKVKMVRSENVNYNFDKITGYTETWGKTRADEVIYSDIGPHILDIEVTTICSHGCKMCYKGNTKVGTNMSLETYKKVLDKFLIECVEIELEDSSKVWVNYRPTITTIGDDKYYKEQLIKNITTNKRSVVQQIAFGADAKAESNPELFDIMNYTRTFGIVPNITVANISDDIADKLSSVAGACSVSRYQNADECYDSIKRLTDRGMTQVNIHIVVSDENKDMLWKTFDDYKNDPRLSKMNAIVLLTLKKKGRGVTQNSLSKEEYDKMVNFVMDSKIKVGFDSCGAGKFLSAVSDYPNYEELYSMSQPCESTRESFYIDVEGKAFPCSFCPNTDSFDVGLDIGNCNNFIEDIWENPRTVTWRNNLLDLRKTGNMDCPVFEI